MPRLLWPLLITLFFGAALFFLLRPASRPPGPFVIVYSSVDSEYALPLFDAFTRDTGIQVVYRPDGEETKSTALALRLEQMKDHPDGDVFWNSEQSLTLMLAKKSVLQAYVSPGAQGIPEEFKDAQGLWTGFGRRARVVVFNTQRVKLEDAPKTLADFSQPRWKGRFAVAKPLYGTTLSHLVALTLQLGEEKAFALFRAWRSNGVILAAGNGNVVEQVASGMADVGLADSDDAFYAIDRNKPIGFALIDQSVDWHGSFLIPNTVAMLKNCPHAAEAHAFIDYLLRPATEKWLAEVGARQIPVRDVGAVLPPPLNNAMLKPVHIPLDRLADNVLPLGDRINKILSGEEP